MLLFNSAVRPAGNRKAQLPGGDFPDESLASAELYNPATATFFVCYYRGWQALRDEDLGVMWEHFVLNELMAQTQNRDVAYWRDKRGHEVDFVLARPPSKPLAIECKWSADNFDPANLRAFRRQRPEGENFVIAEDVERAFSRNYRDLRVRFVGLNAFIGAVLYG